MGRERSGESYDLGLELVDSLLSGLYFSFKIVVGLGDTGVLLVELIDLLEQEFLGRLDCLLFDV